MRKQGFVIPLVMILIALATVLVMSMYRSGSTFVPFMQTVIQREQAKQLALSGIQVAMSQLAVVTEKKTDTQTKAANQDEKALLVSILPTLNQWQTFTSKKETDGFNGEIKMSISAESGKIDLNAVYDFEKRAFKGKWKEILKRLLQNIQKDMKVEQNMFEPFATLLKERHYRFNDATELLTLEPFQVFAGKVFYEPPAKNKQEKRPLYLMDLFTVYGDDTIQPWLFSDSVRAVLGLKRVTEKKNEMVKELLNVFTQETNWKAKWNQTVQPMYGVELQALPNGVDSILQQKFDPKMFSVVSYGIVGSVVQRAYVIIERIKRTVKQQTTYDCKIRKFYWM